MKTRDLCQGMTDEQMKTVMRLGFMPFFSDRPTIQEAYDYAMTVARASGDHVPSVVTAIHVLVNTYALQIANGTIDSADLKIG